MRVAYVVSCYPTLSETFIAREMQELAKLGHEITICRLKWRMPWTRAGGLQVSPARVLKSQFDPLSWGKGLAWSLRKKPNELSLIWQEYRQTDGEIKSKLKLLAILLTVLRLAQCLDGEGIEHVRAHFLHSEAVGSMWLARLLNVPHSITAQMVTFHFPRTIIEKSVRTASFCAATTTETLELLSALRGTERDVHMIRSGIDLQELELNPIENRRSQPLLIVAVGRLAQIKGFDLLIRACSLLKDWGADFACEIIGDGPQNAALSQLVAELDLSERVSLVGALPFEEVKRHYRRASIQVMPSRDSVNGGDRDGLPNVIIEAMAAGVPVVATDLAGIPDLVIHERTGLLVPPEDVAELAVSMRRMLEDDKLRACLTQAGREKVEREYDLAKSARILESLMYQSLPGHS